VNRWAPATTGLATITATVVAVDIYAARTERPTISAAVAHSLEHPVAAPVAVGALCALAWHLVIDPIIRRITSSQGDPHR
jgi:hypothetical protein